MRTKVFIITTPGVDRSENYNKLLLAFNQLNINTELFNGINGNNIIIQNNILTYNNETYNYDPSVRINQQPMSTDEFATAWSHMTLYKKLVSDPNYDNYLILEDHVTLAVDNNSLNTVITSLPEQFDICHLSSSEWYPFICETQINNAYYKAHRQFFNNAVAYFVSKEAATKLISDNLDLPANDLLSNRFVRWQNIEVFVSNNVIFS